MSALLPQIALSLLLGAAPPAPTTPGELLLRIRHLGAVGSVLYVAAHPDDENTRLLAWLAGERGLDATYLSMTRGDGGQNLIGPEQDELFGVIRTQELLAARRIDGAHQRFAATKDFGYSRSADETLRIWGQQAALGDVVHTIRLVQPDVIITRFDTQGSGNHGHHVASAILAQEAFAAAADRQRFPEQLDEVDPWQADRLLRNVSTWRLPKDADMSAYLALEVGTWNPLLGRAFGEIAAASRSMHKSQGFGVGADRGPISEYFEPRLGTAPKGDPLAGLDLTWTRIPGGGAVAQALARAERDFKMTAPWAAVPALLDAHAAIAGLPDNRFKDAKLAATQDLVADCLGLFIEARAPNPAGVRGEIVELELEVINRAPREVFLEAVLLPQGATLRTQQVGKQLARDQPLALSAKATVDANAPWTSAYWLQAQTSGGRYEAQPTWLPAASVGAPESPPALSVGFKWTVGGRSFVTRKPVVHTWVNRVQGQRYRRFEVMPRVTASSAGKAIVFANGEAQQVDVQLRATAATAGRVTLEAPKGWHVQPASVTFDLKERGAVETVRFHVRPSSATGEAGTLKPVVHVGDDASSWRVDEIDYPHIPPQAIVRPAEVRAAAISVKRGAVRRVGYIAGAGDEVTEGLRAIGYAVDVLDDETLATGNLRAWDAIVVGVRAYNAQPRLLEHLPRLLEWVSRGGTLVTQYQANNRLTPLEQSIGPYPLAIGRGRVTEEAAPMKVLEPAHAALTRPNALGPDDFTGWVQERGLYFAETWDPRYTPLLGMADSGQPDQERGALLVARHGKGAYVYCGLSLFRQIPAGVPGAHRLLANLLAL